MGMIEIALIVGAIICPPLYRGIALLLIFKIAIALGASL